jgi:hypothetical protein
VRSQTELLKRLVCADRCRFFKPWQGEGGCASLIWLEGFARTNEQALSLIERSRTARPRLPLAADGLFRRHVCERCTYYPAGCAYRRPAQDTGVPPCGGLIVLALLMDCGAISEEDLYSPPWGQLQDQPRPPAACAAGTKQFPPCRNSSPSRNT